MPKFPDTSLNALAMLMLATIIASVVGIGLQRAFGNPPAQSVLQFGIGAIAFIVGFGIVYGWDIYKGYRSR